MYLVCRIQYTEKKDVLVKFTGCPYRPCCLTAEAVDCRISSKRAELNSEYSVNNFYIKNFKLSITSELKIILNQMERGLLRGVSKSVLIARKLQFYYTTKLPRVNLFLENLMYV